MSPCTSYFNSQLYSRLLITYGRLPKKLMKPLVSEKFEFETGLLCWEDVLVKIAFGQHGWQGLHLLLILLWVCRLSHQCIRTMATGYALSSFFAPGDRHAIVGNKVCNTSLFIFS